MHATKASTILAVIAIVTAIALVTAGSLTDSVIAVKKHKSKSTSSTSTGGKSSSTTGGVSKLISCIRALPGSFTRSDVDNCYDTVYNTAISSSSGASSSASGGSVPVGTP